MVKNPTPPKKVIDKFITQLQAEGNSAGNKKLQEKLSLSDNDYSWVKDYLINEGVIVPGRGRGGSVKLLNAEPQTAVTSIPKAKKPKTEPVQTYDEDYEDNTQPNEPLEVIKSKYIKVKDDLSAFKKGMKVVRPMTSMFSEEYAWNHSRTYIVTNVDNKYVYVQPHPNRKKEPELSALPRGFYTKNPH